MAVPSAKEEVVQRRRARRRRPGAKIAVRRRLGEADTRRRLGSGVRLASRRRRRWGRRRGGEALKVCQKDHEETEEDGAKERQFM